MSETKFVYYKTKEEALQAYKEYVKSSVSVSINHYSALDSVCLSRELWGAGVKTMRRILDEAFNDKRIDEKKLNDRILLDIVSYTMGYCLLSEIPVAREFQEGYKQYFANLIKELPSQNYGDKDKKYDLVSKELAKIYKNLNYLDAEWNNKYYSKDLGTKSMKGLFSSTFKIACILNDKEPDSKMMQILKDMLDITDKNIKEVLKTDIEWKAQNKVIESVSEAERNKHDTYKALWDYYNMNYASYKYSIDKLDKIIESIKRDSSGDERKIKEQILVAVAEAKDTLSVLDTNNPDVKRTNEGLQKILSSIKFPEEQYVVERKITRDKFAQDLEKYIADIKKSNKNIEEGYSIADEDKKFYDRCVVANSLIEEMKNGGKRKTAKAEASR